MKVSDKLNENVKTSGGTSKTNFRLDDESMGFFLKTFSDSIYSNKIGSIVREITSNCFDSHIEAGVKTNVRIEIIDSDAFGTAADVIEFTDYGVGLSPERVQDIFSVYFKSTKRKGNDQIGGFGIGSKSPLSYTDTFSITTRYEGTEYEYIVYRGEKTPVIELVDQRDTKLHNGTTVSIPIKDHQDVGKFRQEIRNQLMFFDNIDFVNCGMENDYKIIKGDHIIYRVEKDSPVSRSHTMYACLGRVAYPLDLDLLYTNGAVPYSSHEYNTPIALFFDIGELSVTVNREQLEYSKENIATIGQRYKDAVAEIKRRQEDSLESDNLAEYVLSMNQRSYEVVLGGMTVSIQGLGKARKRTFAPLEEGELSNYLYMPFAFPTYISEGRVRTSEIENGYYAQTVKMLLLDAKAKKMNSPMDDRQRHQFLENIKDIQLVRMSTNPSKRQLLYIQEQFPGKRLLIVKKTTDDALDAARGKTRCVDTVPKGYKDSGEYYDKVIYPLLEELILNHSVRYEDYEPTEKWIAEYMERLKQERLGKTYIANEDVTLRTCKIKGGARYGDVKPAYEMLTQPINKTQIYLANKKMFVYGMNTDSEVLGNIRGFLDHFKLWISNVGNSYNYWEYDSDAEIVKIAKQNQKYFRDMPNGMTIEEFYDKFKHRARQILAYRVINKRRADIELLKMNKHLLPKKVFAILQDILTFMNEFSFRGDPAANVKLRMNGHSYRPPESPVLESDFRNSLNMFINELADFGEDENVNAFFTIKDKKSKKCRTFEVISRFKELVQWIDTYPLITMLHLNPDIKGELPEHVKGENLYTPLQQGERIIETITNNRTISKIAFREYILKTKPSTLNYE